MPGDTWLPPIFMKSNSNTSHTDGDSYSTSSENRTSATPPSPSSGRSSGSSRGVSGYHEPVAVTPRFPVIEQNHWNCGENRSCEDIDPPSYRRSQRQKLCRSPSCPQLHLRDGNFMTSRSPDKLGGRRKHAAAPSEREDLMFPAILPGIRETGAKSVSPNKNSRKARHLVKQNSKSDPDITRACERSLDSGDPFGVKQSVPNRNALLWPIKEADVKTPLKAVDKKRLANANRNCLVDARGKRRDGLCAFDSEST